MKGSRIITKRADGSVRVTEAPRPAERRGTQQQYKDDTDVNKIFDKYARTGQLPPMQGRKGVYMDATLYGDYHECMNKISKANQEFMRLDPIIRKRFGNSPQQLLDFLSNPANTQEAVKLGLATAPVVPVNQDGSQKPTAPVVPVNQDGSQKSDKEPKV